MKDKIEKIAAIIIIILGVYIVFFAVASLILWNAVFHPGQLSTTGRVLFLIYILLVIAAIDSDK